MCSLSLFSSECGCLTEKFIERARNFFILSMNQSAEEFATKMKALARHAHDEYEWDESRCDFDLPRACRCVKCEDKEDLQCEGKDYHTKYLLSCPFHSLAYERDGRNAGSLHSEEGSF